MGDKVGLQSIERIMWLSMVFLPYSSLRWWQGTPRGPRHWHCGICGHLAAVDPRVKEWGNRSAVRPPPAVWATRRDVLALEMGCGVVLGDVLYRIAH